MSLTILLVVLVLGAAALLLSAFTGRKSRYSTIPHGSARRDNAQDVYWEARVLAALKGNRAALERSVLHKQRQRPGLKRWQLLRLVYLDATRRAPSRAKAAPRAGVFRTHF
ncbi:hypothetical protein GO986_03135 [Deinococcus sp. HMF7620]|uniref:Uncharacterized protein n=1 Tax=Deinococcus arboris TaxID=2682977 RepID=A0A7C9HPW7_9DEIO|nr:MULTISPECIES: hypothetical protein [Deinococcus]MBZ9751209.1 hypothetical protein [Deinococcus betulae]MVN85754.1 hypothetical protein [Deinococcus arboris]